MLTDIFAYRYADRIIWDEYTVKEKRLLVQSFRILQEQLAPYYDYNGNERPEGKVFWTDIHRRLSTELGMKSLSQTWYSYPYVYSGKETTVTKPFPSNTVCENWVFAEPTIEEDVDRFIKERLSLVEIAFRKRHEAIDELNAKSPKNILEEKLRPKPRSGQRLPGNYVDGLKAQNKQTNDHFANAVNELNTRFRQAGCRLQYHNGFIQISEDERLAEQLERPFWALVAAPEWKNVDIDMKEALNEKAFFLHGVFIPFLPIDMPTG